MVGNHDRVLGAKGKERKRLSQRKKAGDPDNAEAVTEREKKGRNKAVR